MMNRTPSLLSLIPVLLSITATVSAAGQPRELSWYELIPEDERDTASMITEPTNDSAAPAEVDAFMEAGFGARPVASLNGKFVKLPGYVVPLESDEGGLLDEFLLVPYYGACIHVPPPPANQIVYVKLDEAVEVRDITRPYWIIGTMKTWSHISGFAEAVYQMPNPRLEPFD